MQPFQALLSLFRRSAGARASGVDVDAGVLPDPGRPVRGEYRLSDDFNFEQWAFPDLRSYLRSVKLEPEAVFKALNIADPERIRVVNPEAADYVFRKETRRSRESFERPPAVRRWLDHAHRLGLLPEGSDFSKKAADFAPDCAVAFKRVKDGGRYDFLKPLGLDVTLRAPGMGLDLLPPQAFVFSNADFDKSFWFFVFCHELSHLSPAVAGIESIVEEEAACDRTALKALREILPGARDMEPAVLAWRSIALKAGGHANALILDPHGKPPAPGELEAAEKVFNDCFDEVSVSHARPDGTMADRKTLLAPLLGLTAKIENSTDVHAFYPAVTRRLEMFRWACSYLTSGQPERPPAPRDPAVLEGEPPDIEKTFFRPKFKIRINAPAPA